MKITIFNEGRDEKIKPEVLKVYPDGIGAVLQDILKEMPEADVIKVVNLYEPECGLTEEILKQTDVLLYWSHGGNEEFPDYVAERIRDRVLCGMGFVVLHSANGAKAFKMLMGTSCTMRYRHDDCERVICCNPTHPIAQGVADRFVLEKEETYGEFFDIPKPDDIIYLGWFDSGEAFRSICTWSRGYGKIAYLQPGHETNPTFYHPDIRRLIQNSCQWATPAQIREQVQRYTEIAR